MYMRIAALAPRDLLAAVVDVAEDLPGVVIVPCGYDDLSETETLISRLDTSVSGYLFNGPATARRAASVLPQHVHGATVRYDAAATSNALFRVYREIPEAMDRGVSLDSLGSREFEEMAAELGLDQSRFQRYDMRRPWDVEAVASYHRSMLSSGEVAAAAVSLRSAYRQLQAEGLPVFDIRPTKAAIRDALTELTLRIIHATVPAERMATVFIDLADPPPNNSAAARRVLARYLGRLLADRSISDLRTSDRLLVVSGNASQLNSVAGPEGQLCLRIQRATGLKVRVGYGEAETLPESRRRAGLAFHSVQQAGAFAVMSYHDAKVADEPVAGLDVRQPGLADKPSSAMKSAILQARDLRRQLGTAKVTATEVADALGLTKRSGRRLLLAWSDCGVAQLRSTRRTGLAGRPELEYEIRV